VQRNYANNSKNIIHFNFFWKKLAEYFSKFCIFALFSIPLFYLTMSRRDEYHSIAKTALQKDGWIITADPLDLTVGGVELWADLGAERLLAAEKENEKIAVEIKSFLGQSPVSEFHKALGQYENYQLSLEILEPDRKVWLAISKDAWEDFFQRDFIQKAIERFKIGLIIFEVENQTIISWIK